jgi:hypothetical protein
MDKMVISNRVFAYNDTYISNNPLRKYVDWARNYMDLEVSNPKSNPYKIAARETVNVFSGLVSTSIGADTKFTLAISPVNTSHYRFTWTGVGVNPVFRTNRAIVTTGKTYTWLANGNLTVTLTSSLTNDFSAVAVGDWVYVPDTSLGDSIATPFDALNSGYWYVISKDSTNTILQIYRGDSVDFEAYSGAFAATGAADMVIYSASGVQIGNKVDVSAGFTANVQQLYTIAGVSPTWVEIVATGALPVTQTAVPGVSGMLFYNTSKNFILVEYDQECVIQINGDVTLVNRLAPWIPGDKEHTGQYMRTGPTWSMNIINKSIAELNVVVITAE